jgi:hypothetical protein
MSCLSRSRLTSDSGALASVGREVGERPEVGVEVDGERAQPEMAGEDVAGEEGARRLAAPALRRQRGDNVRPRHAGEATQARLELCLLAFAGGDEQRAHEVAQAAERRIRRRLAVHDGRVVEVGPAGPGQPV